MKISTCLICCVLSLLSMSNSYGFFWSKSSIPSYEKNFHYAFKPGELASYKELDSIIEKRKQEVVVFNSVVEEKNTEIQEMNTVLQNQYGVHPSRVYSYNSTNLTIYVTIEKDGEKKILPHRIFVTPEEGDAFVKILLGKQTSIQQVILLNAMLEEKRLELTNAQNVMQSFFLIDPSKKYVLDEKEENIYEVRPPKTKEQIKAEKEAYRKNKEKAKKEAEAAKKQKKAAAKKAREEAEAKKKALKLEKKHLEAEIEKSEDILDDCKDQLKVQQARLEDSKEELASLEKKLAKVKSQKPSESNTKKINELTKEISKYKQIISVRNGNVLNSINNISVAEKNISIHKKKLDAFCKANNL